MKIKNDLDPDQLRREWIHMSTPWIRESREGKNAKRAGLIDEPLLELCGDLSGKSVLDCGCGEGRFCRIMARQGAGQVLGIDLCEPMIEAARELPVERVTYRVADAEILDFLEEGSFDLAISYLNQCDLADFEANTREVYRVLKPGGRFIIANLHPMRSAVGRWHKDETGNKEHVILDHYLDEGPRTWKIMGVPITNFHRSLETYMNTFIRVGFQVKCIREPTVSPVNLQKYPELEDELRVPNFILFELLKDGER